MKNWKTTLAGILSGLAIAVTGKPDLHSALLAIGVALVGVLSKDLDK